MAGLETFMWRSGASWNDLTKIAQDVVSCWNTVTQFAVKRDERERMWTVRHASSAQPFLVLNQDSLRGSAPRIGNPLPMLLLLGMARRKPGCVELSFANGSPIHPEKFELADLTALLPHATHAAHYRLAELALTLPQVSPTPGLAAPTDSKI